MNIVSINVNGIRAYYNKGALNDLIDTLNPDIICFQETKCSEEVFEEFLEEFVEDWQLYSNSNKWRKGYSGVGMMIRKGIDVKVENISILDEYGEGRIITADVNKQDLRFKLLAVYTLNSGDKDDLRQSWDKAFYDLIKSISDPVVIVGDLNVVRNYLDYDGDFEDAPEYPGMKDYERDNIETLIRDCDLVDSFRDLHPKSRCYSWFSYASNARARNKGWRIDLALVSSNIMYRVKKSCIHSKMTGSDHSPIQLIIE